MLTTSAAQTFFFKRAVRSTLSFVVFVCTAIIAVTVWLAVQGRDENIRQATVADTNLTQAIAQQMDSLFSETAWILDTLAFEIERTSKEATALARLQPVLVSYASKNEQVHSLNIFDGKGVVLASSDAMPSSLSGVTNPDYLRIHRDSPSLTRRVGKAYLSSGGTWLIPVSRRLNDSAGQFSGVILATIKADSVQQLFAKYKIGEHGALTLLLADGAVLSRRPFTPMEMSIAGSTLFELTHRLSAGNVTLISPIDGVERYLSFKHLDNHPLLVMVAQSKQEVLQDWRATTYVQAILILSLCVCIFLSGILLIRSARQRLKMHRRLREARFNLTAANTQLTHLARYDGLTGLANREFFDEYLTQELSKAMRTNQPLALIAIDIDHFKHFNDTYGHLQGDKCLQILARTVKAAARRSNDFVGRYSGAEIGVILPNTDAIGASVVAKSIHAAMALENMIFESSSLGVITASIGITAHKFSGPKASAFEMLNAAARALRQAKSNGRNCIVLDV